MKHKFSLRCLLGRHHWIRGKYFVLGIPELPIYCKRCGKHL